MQSFLINHFPHIIHRDGNRLLWNPLLKKAFKNLPEERVRLQTLEFLLHDVKWPSARISCETAIRNIMEEANTVRADMICYDQNFKPFLIIECKASAIRLSEKTSCQIAGYNRKVKAPYLYLTNGVNDIFVQTDGEGGTTVFIKPEQIFDSLNDENQDHLTLEYYCERGFAGKNTSPIVCEWLTKALPKLYAQGNTIETRFLDMGKTPGGEPLNHYYKLFNLSGHYKLALSFLSAREGDTRLIAILNEQGTNTGIVEINLDKLAKKESEAAFIYTPSETTVTDMSGLIDFNAYDEQQVSDLPERILDKLK